VQPQCSISLWRMTGQSFSVKIIAYDEEWFS
jgi:hypothetical protein